MNNKAIIEFVFRIIWRIMEISEGVIRNTLLEGIKGCWVSDTVMHILKGSLHLLICWSNFAKKTYSNTKLCLI